ncbi:hypothetical protein EG329_001448 [Mollisiaceae sp. DMI_Dod_QoI]|nr:hypothetical protein EG329_001448 [Helotiales sp. DMI_Dod_QoI]
MSCKSLKKPEHGDDIGHEMLTIGVGMGEKRQFFSIHKNLLQKVTKYFDKLLQTGAGKQGNLFMNTEDPAIFQMFYDWLYTGNIEKAPTQFKLKKRPSAEESERLETDLRARFDAQEQKLVGLYCLAEKLDINDLQNRTIDTIQDGFHEYGTVFGPGLIIRIFKNTKNGSQLRELCVATNVMHMDRGCGQLREELMMACIVCPDFMPHMLKWISRNFVMFGRRSREGYDARKCTEGFSMLNRSKLCPCHFHKHGPGEAHKYHKKCAVPYMTCGHEEEDADAAASRALGTLTLNTV